MIYIFLCILLSTLIFVTFKLFDRFKVNNFQAITINYLIACVFGYITVDSNLSFNQITELPWLPNGIVIGILFIVVFNIFALSAQKAGVAITAVSSKMSVILPVALGFIVFKEHIIWLKVIGIVFALLAFYLTFKKDKTAVIDKKYMLLPLILFFGNGINDTTMSFTKKTFGIATDNDVMLLLNVIFTTSLIIGVVYISISIIRGKVKLELKNIYAGIILGLLNYASTFYFFKSLSLYDNSVFFPIFNVSIVAMSAIIGFLVFKERLKLINWAGILLAIAAILLIAFAEKI
ncbi:MAG: EamA/RhaT family transporter [Bacteroidota bacterium]